MPPSRTTKRTVSSFEPFSLIFHIIYLKVNSRVSFDEFLAIKKADFMYKCKYDPEIIYEYSLHHLNPNNPADYMRMPENVIETATYKQDALDQYHTEVQRALINKELFKKVDALEYFGDHMDYGRGPKFAPKHNAYTPAPTIMPIPKFVNYDKEDYLGEDFTYRTRGNHTPSPMIQPSTLKPTPYEPMLPEHEDPFLSYHQGRRRAMRKWSRYRTTN